MFLMKPFFPMILVGFSLFSMIMLSSPFSRGAHEAHALTGVFAPPVTYPVGSYPFGIVSGNFMSAGHQDLAVTNELSDAVSILANDGSGTFTTHAFIHVGSNPVGIVTGSFNSLGRADLAVTNVGDNTVIVLLNNGDGTFTAQPPIAVGSNPIGIVAGNFMGLGHQDLAVTNELSNTISILANNGSGIFTAQPPIAVGNSPIGIVTGDLMGLGHADLAVANSSASANSINILSNNGSGAFTLQAPITVGHSPQNSWLVTLWVKDIKIWPSRMPMITVLIFYPITVVGLLPYMHPLWLVAIHLESLPAILLDWDIKIWPSRI